MLFRCVVKLILLSNSSFAINVWYTKLLLVMLLMCCRKEIYLKSMVVFKGYLPSSPRTKLLGMDLFTPRTCLQNDRCTFSMGLPSHFS